jgi:hypothetical protein
MCGFIGEESQYGGRNTFNRAICSTFENRGFRIESENSEVFIMLNNNSPFSSFSVDDIQKAMEFYDKTLGLELSNGPEGTLVVPFSGGTEVLMYPKPNHQPATFTVLNFPVESVEKTVE